MSRTAAIDVGVADGSEHPLLVDRLTQTADRRHLVIRSSRGKRSARSYDKKAWFSMAIGVRNKGFTSILIPLLLVTINAAVFTWYSTQAATVDVCNYLEQGKSAFGMVLSALAFLLVFRLNRASVRHYEARQLCGWMMIHCRDVAMAANATLGRAQPEIRDRLCEIVVAYPVAFMLHMWGRSTKEADDQAFARLLHGVFRDRATFAAIQEATHRPLALIELAEVVIHDAIWQDDPATAAKSDGASLGSHYRRKCVYQQLLHSIRGLGAPLGGCERIQGTPLPYIYVAHLRSFLLTVLAAVPVVYSCEWLWATLPLSLLISLALLGLEAASIECEQPFSSQPTKNHHDLERFAELVSTEVRDMLDRARARERRQQSSC